MTTIEQIHYALDNVFLPLGIHTHRYRKEEIDGEKQIEYIVLSPVSNDAISHANDTALLTASNIDVRYYAKKEAYSEEHLALIINTLKSEGLSIPNGTFFAESLTDNDFITATTEAERIDTNGY